MKTESKAAVGHTAGPWLAWITEGKRKEQGVYGPNSETVALCDEDLDMPVETREANTRLIAAAPELLAALKEAEEWLLEVDEDEPQGMNHAALKDTLKRINDVICKVERRGQ